MSTQPDQFSTTGNRPVIGKDVLELLSTAMYVDPLTVYREYTQNAADAIDEACQAGLLQPGEGRIEITIDQSSRTVRIRDNGIGISAKRFYAILTAIGASKKRGTGARGFRGVGRLSGLAYARELTFRSSAAGETSSHSITWDCRALRGVLRDFDDSRELADIVEAIIVTDRADEVADHEHFFEVTLTGIPRIGDDRLLSQEAVADYLAQAAPLPFSNAFALGPAIDEQLSGFFSPNRLTITINGEEPLTRAFADEIPITGGRPLALREARFLEVPSVDGGVAAFAWIAHHDYEGAIHTSTRVRGLRARVGDIQVGDTTVFEDIFPETRFNSWTVGEVHILDPRIIPNGRRDDFERNVHLANLKNHLAPLGREIATKCRSSSRNRKRLRDFELAKEAALENLDILQQGSLSSSAKEQIALSIDLTILKMEKLAEPDKSADGQVWLEQEVIDDIRTRLGDVTETDAVTSPLERMSPDRRELYEEMFSLIYECSVNRSAAKALVDRILQKLA
ncbi:MAG: ATP-binding protein [Erythrobacter sp.]